MVWATIPNTFSYSLDTHWATVLYNRKAHIYVREKEYDALSCYFQLLRCLERLYYDHNRSIYVECESLQICY